MESLKSKIVKFRYSGVIAVVLVFALISFILFLERSGIKFNYNASKLDFLPEEAAFTKAQACATLDKNALVLWNSGKADSKEAMEQFEVILTDMKQGFESLDLAKDELCDFDDYETVIVLLSELDVLGVDIISLCDMVYEGGNVLFALTLSKSPYTSIIENKLGILDSSYEYALVDSIYVEEDFMIGGGRAFAVSDAYDSAWTVQLIPEKTSVLAYTNDERRLPLIWETNYGKGKFIVNNFGLYEKVMRGFFASSLSLTGDVFVYPVINGSAFYLDDFPSQIPSGNSEYIERDYNTTIRDFYVNIWWPDMMNFADKYGMKYTGLAIECYNDTVDGTTDALPDKGTFLNFGNMLMRHKGEIGYHGFNHQPLCFDNCDYKGVYEYKTWESYGAMHSAFDELVRFCDELFPDVKIQLYVPPSNLLSDEGRAFLKKEYPYIKTISGVYFEDAVLDFACVQEFDAASDGIVDSPRIASGCAFDDFLKLAVISELNLHYVNTHFTHPDDALDPDRGAEMGWEKLKTHFDEYLSWLYSSAPDIRNFTGSELSAAVQRFAALTVKKNVYQDKMVIELGNFHDEAQLFVRFNERTPDKVKGGKLTKLAGNLYLLEATTNIVTVSFK